MRIFFLALALLIFGWAAQAQASQFKGYYYGAKSPGEIAALVETSLAKDSTGMTLLSEDNCRTKGGCARPVDYMTSFAAHDPQGAPKSLAELPGYLRKLVIRHDFQGKYQMDRIVYGRGVHRADVNGMSRTFLKGEAAWVNPETGRPVLAENCANPVGVRIDLDCVYIDAEIRHPSEFSLVWARYEKPDDKCFAYRRVNRLFQADSPTAQWLNPPRGCIGRPCTLDAVNQVLGRRQVAQGQIPVRTGIYQIRLSRNEFVVLCLKSRTQSGVASSFSAGVSWQQDYQLVGREWHSRVYYLSDELRRDDLRLGNGPRSSVFYASTKSDELVMQGVSEEPR